MTSTALLNDFSTLLTNAVSQQLLMQLKSLRCEIQHDLKSIQSLAHSQDINFHSLLSTATEQEATDTLITLFNDLFANQQVQLIRGQHEPEYFPATNNHFARIEFAHGFFASALHEISHWSLAGKARRQLSDFGYWYAADGRNEAQQSSFEQVEIKPQAIECLLTLACKRKFVVSQDNLFATFDTSTSSFAEEVYQQALAYINTPSKLPRDAQTLLLALLSLRIKQVAL